MKNIIITMFHESYYSFLPNRHFSTVVMYTANLSEELFFLTFMLGLSSLTASASLYMRQQFIQCNNLLAKMIGTNQIHKSFDYIH